METGLAQRFAQLYGFAVSEQIQEIAGMVGVENAAHLLSTLRFYDTTGEAFDVLYVSLRRVELPKNFDFKSFSREQRGAYERRCQAGIPHTPRLLEYALDCSENQAENYRMLEGGKRVSLHVDDPDSSSWGNVVRASEE